MISANLQVGDIFEDNGVWRKVVSLYGSRGYNTVICDKPETDPKQIGFENLEESMKEDVITTKATRTPTKGSRNRSKN